MATDSDVLSCAFIRMLLKLVKQSRDIWFLWIKILFAVYSAIPFLLHSHHGPTSSLGGRNTSIMQFPCQHPPIVISLAQQYLSLVFLARKCNKSPLESADAFSRLIRYDPVSVFSRYTKSCDAYVPKAWASSSDCDTFAFFVANSRSFCLSRGFPM
jgi:hypothetical protein